MINLRARARRGALFLSAGVAALVIANPAMAQGMQDQDPVDVTTSSADAPAERAITVTGSRIRNPNLQPFEPTTSIDREFIDQRNFINVAVVGQFEIFL